MLLLGSNINGIKLPVEIVKENSFLILSYIDDESGFGWSIESIFNTLDDKEKFFLKKTFYLSKKDLYDSLKADCIENRNIKFIIGTLDKDYYKIEKTILDINYNLYFFHDIQIKTKHFISYQDISVFKRIDELKIDQSIYIGGQEQSNLPIEVFDKLIKKFPNKHEVKLYVKARVSGIIKDYLDIPDEADVKYESYLNKKIQSSTKKDSSLELLINAEEKRKYEYLKEKLENMLIEQNKYNYSEKDWQKEFLGIFKLLFPRYITILSDVEIKSPYANSSEKKKLDYLFIDSNGYVDIVEIKKPHDNELLYRSKERDNYVPIKHLSSAVMQTEKYIFYLTRWGERGEEELNKKHLDKIPSGLKIKIINPKGMIIMGRENSFKSEQKQDFEIIKRQYKNVIEIITYDDLIQRIKNQIECLIN